MAITVLFGPGGSGKSFLQALIVERELTTTNRNIVTNLALDLPALCAYLESKYDRDFRILQRVRILTHEEAHEFWKHRGPRRLIPDAFTPMAFSFEEDKGEDGVLFILDEAGACGFSATGWAAKVGQSTRGEQVLWYLDQQRKFGDDVIASCNGRMPTAIAKPFRDKAHYFVRLKNGYQSQFGWFRGRGKFYAFHYAQEPGPNVEVMKKETWELDPKGIASCYRTQDGMGIVGKKADMGKRAKGIPILWVFPLFIVAGLLTAAIPYLLGKGAEKALTADVAQAAEVKAPVHVPEDVRPLVQSSQVEKVPEVRDQGEPVQVRGYVARAGKVQVLLSDGRTLTERDQGLDAVDRAGIVWQGRRVYLMQPEKRGDSPRPSAPVDQAKPDPAPSPMVGKVLGSWRQDEDGVQRLVAPESLPSLMR